ncbi:MAG: enoyl-[acyl-carrier-protein] reductase FabK, partial [Schwartzia sp.]|nr:enoyl-[acyl-carrier-protein] reductase FabK [Schwartzia sp. (in: firmicutes)]
ITGRTTGHPARVVQNKLTRIYFEKEAAGASAEELEKLGLGTLRMAAREGDVEMGSVMIGQISGMMNDIKPVRVILEDLVNGVSAVAENARKNFR